tara:strand:+ start:92 stop:625 length:534 start_codon:yes stop_codon:yes gene_type:complete
MDSVTPIDQLSNMNNQDQQVNNTVDDIINKINGDEMPMEMPQGMQQEMPQEMQQEMPQEIPQEMPMEMQNIQLQAPPTEVMPPQQVVQQVIQQQQNVDTRTLNTKMESLGNTIITQLKQPLLILILYCLLNIKQVDNVFKLKNIKFLVSETGELTFLSVIIKGIILSLLFYLIKLFI